MNLHVWRRSKYFSEKVRLSKPWFFHAHFVDSSMLLSYSPFSPSQTPSFLFTCSFHAPSFLRQCSSHTPSFLSTCFFHTPIFPSYMLSPHSLFPLYMLLPYSLFSPSMLLPDPLFPPYMLRPRVNTTFPTRSQKTCFLRKEVKRLLTSRVTYYEVDM